MDLLTTSMLAIPDPVKWALAIVGAAIGLAMILAPDRVIRRLRQWLLLQLRWIRRPGYRRMLKVYGWLLLVTGVLLMILLMLMAGR
ncbi:MAG TPA: hypothetical protein VMN38_09000 [Sphingomicrobium sp.]|nr:hypothetical protein [Sphingomicrobium sp.]